MTKTTNVTVTARQRRVRLAATSALVAPAILLAGCSWTPDWANPVSWYDSVFSSDDANVPAPKTEAPALQTGEKVPGEKESFPKLGSVPDRPKAAGTPAQRQALAKGLVADRANAKYTDQVVRAGGATPNAQGPARTAAPAAPTRSAAVSNLPVAPGTPSRDSAAMTSTSPPPPPTPRPVLSTQPVASAPPMMAAATPDRSETMTMPSIVQRRGQLPPLPPSVVPGVVSRDVPSIVQRRPKAMAAPVPPPLTGAAPTMAAAPAVPPPLMPTATPAPRMAAIGSSPPQVALPVTQNQSTLMRVFNQHLAASASDTWVPPASGGFAAPQATPIANLPASVPAVVRDTYNAALSASNGVTAGGFASTTPAVIIKFGHGGVGLTRSARQMTARIAKQAKERGGYVRVVGHASQRTGSMDYGQHQKVNFNISFDRANAVARELLRRGVPADRIIVEAVGDTQPIYYEFMPDGEAQNRRAEIFLE